MLKRILGKNHKKSKKTEEKEQEQEHERRWPTGCGTRGRVGAYALCRVTSTLHRVVGPYLGPHQGTTGRAACFKVIIFLFQRDLEPSVSSVYRSGEKLFDKGGIPSWIRHACVELLMPRTLNEGLNNIII